MQSQTIDKRRHERYDFPSKIEYSLNTQTGDEVLQGVTINISEAGLCLYTFYELIEAEKINIKSVLPLRRQAAIVRWIKKINPDFYKVGLTFM